MGKAVSLLSHPPHVQFYCIAPPHTETVVAAKVVWGISPANETTAQPLVNVRTPLPPNSYRICLTAIQRPMFAHPRFLPTPPAKRSQPSVSSNHPHLLFPLPPDSHCKALSAVDPRYPTVDLPPCCPCP